MPPKMPMKSKGMRGAPKQKAKKGTKSVKVLKIKQFLSFILLEMT